MMAGITKGSRVMNSTIGRNRGKRNCTQYAVGTTSRMPITIVARARTVEYRKDA